MAKNHDIVVINTLILKIAKDDERALEKLFNDYNSKLKSIARFYLSDESHINDVLSEVYFKIYKSAKTYDKTKNGLNWIHEIIKNTAYDYNRQSNSQNEISYDENIMVESNKVNEHHNKEKVKYLLRELTDTERIIVIERFWKNSNFEEISRLLNISISTVSRTYDKVLLKLRNYYEQVEEEKIYEK